MLSRSAKASSVVSRSAASTTSRKATSSRRSRCARSRAADRRVYVGALELDVLLGDVHSLKEKRSLVRPVVAELRRKFEVAVAEAGPLAPHRRSLIGVTCV